MLVENPAIFLADFGVSATWYAAPWIVDRDSGPSLDSSKFGLGGLMQQTARVLFDMPQRDILHGMVSSTAYRITFPADQFVGIKHGDAMVINGVKYAVIQPNTLDDGAWSETELQAV